MITIALPIAIDQGYLRYNPYALPVLGLLAVILYLGFFATSGAAIRFGEGFARRHAYLGPILTILVFATVGGLVGFVWYVALNASKNHVDSLRHSESAGPGTAESQPIPSAQPPLQNNAPPKASEHVDLSLPLVLEFHVIEDFGAKQKLVTINNRGLVGIEDIKLEIMKYIFDEEGWESGILRPAFSTQMGVLKEIKRIPAKQDSESMDMGTMRWIELYTWDDEVKAQHFQNPSERNLPGRTYYCLRFTFRDERTKQKFVYYKTTSAIKNAPLPTNEKVNLNETNFRPFIFDIPAKVRERALELYGTEYPEYKP